VIRISQREEREGGNNSPPSPRLGQVLARFRGRSGLVPLLFHIGAQGHARICRGYVESSDNGEMASARSLCALQAEGPP